MFCGWDWGSTAHAVCVIDDDGALIDTWMVGHTEHELAMLFAQLAELGEPASLPVAIERGEGLVVGLIAGAGHPVMMVEPAAFKAARPRWGSAGAKSDSADAFMLADYARTDSHRLRRVEPVAQPQPRAGRRPVRGSTGHEGLRKVPLHRKQAGTRGHHQLRRQLSPLLGLGR